MTRAGALSQSRMRQRKLNTRAALQIIGEDDLHEADDDLPRVLSGLDSGVEKAEQNVCLPQHKISPRDQIKIIKIIQIGTPFASCSLSFTSCSSRR